MNDAIKMFVWKHFVVLFLPTPLTALGSVRMGTKEIDEIIHKVYH